MLVVSKKIMKFISTFVVLSFLTILVFADGLNIYQLYIFIILYKIDTPSCDCTDENCTDPLCDDFIITGSPDVFTTSFCNPPGTRFLIFIFILLYTNRYSHCNPNLYSNGESL